MLIDSHTHLPSDKKEVQNIIDHAKQNEVTKMICIGTELPENQNAIRLAEEFDEIYAAVGIYPHMHRGENLDEVLKKLEDQLTQSKKVVALGECGIDITNWAEQRSVPDQLDLFRNQIELAIKYKLPIVIHNRNGDEHVLKLLSEYHNQIKGVAHCFDTSWDTAKKLLDLNFYISFSGFITYNSKKYLHETVEKVPNDRYLVETDSPYIVPKGCKDKQNEPKNVRMVGQKVAEIKGISFEEACKNSYTNTCNLFKI